MGRRYGVWQMIDQSAAYWVFAALLVDFAAVMYLGYKVLYPRDCGHVIAPPLDAEVPGGQKDHLKHVYGDEPEFAVKQWKAYRCRVCGILSYRKRNKTAKDVEL